LFFCFCINHSSDCIHCLFGAIKLGLFFYFLKFLYLIRIHILNESELVFVGVFHPKTDKLFVLVRRSDLFDVWIDRFFLFTYLIFIVYFFVFGGLLLFYS